MSVELIISGDRELDRAFANFTPKLQKKIARKALRQAAAPLRDKIRALAPKDEGDYQATIVIRAMKQRRRSSRVGVRVVTDPKRLAKITEAGQTLFNPHWLEFGTSRMFARPHFRPGLRSSAGTVIGTFRSLVKPLIAETAREV